jgi:hypothetical protein
MPVPEPKESSFQCSPALHRREGESCLPVDAQRRIISAWNKSQSRKNRIPLGQSAGTTRKQRHAPSSSGGSSPSLLKEMKQVMRKQKCSTEFCVVKKTPEVSKQKTLLSYFRPEKPKEWDKKPGEWLDSFNIEDVMLQYEEADPSFEFIGPTPIDFDKELSVGKCVMDELCKMDINSLNLSNGKKKIGIVFNLDPHDKPGSHWVCAFVDIPNKAAYYFDSYGYEPPRQIIKFLKRCKEQGCDTIQWNDIRHQRRGSECGMYCLFVIICLLRGQKSFLDICKHVVDDETMNSFRDILFAEEKPSRVALEKALPRLCT